MNSRGILWAAAALALVACGGTQSQSANRSFAPAPRPAEASTEMPEGPETDEDRATGALAELADYCHSHTAACRAADEGTHPDQVSDDELYYIDDRRQEVGTLGLQLRWNEERSEFEAIGGNSPVFGSELRDDP